MISLENVSYSYRRRATVFESISLDLPSGGVTGVLGLNGVGKTTLLKLLAGLLNPRTGTIRVVDETPRKQTAEYLQQIFFVPDQFDLLRSLSIDGWARRVGAFYPRFDRKYFHELLDAFSVLPTMRAGQASLGQKKKMLIAFGFATRPRVMLMDEPMSGLDLPSKLAFREALVDQINEDSKVLISTHEVRELPTLLDELCMLSESDALSINLAHASQVLSQRDSSEALPGAIYSESNALGYTSLVAEPTPSESELDIEFLFRAFVAAPAALRTELEKGMPQ